jgi:hypothetical protein
MPGIPVLILALLISAKTEPHVACVVNLGYFGFIPNKRHYLQFLVIRQTAQKPIRHLKQLDAIACRNWVTIRIHRLKPIHSQHPPLYLSPFGPVHLQDTCFGWHASL